MYARRESIRSSLLHRALCLETVLVHKIVCEVLFRNRHVEEIVYMIYLFVHSDKISIEELKHIY